MCSGEREGRSTVIEGRRFPSVDGVAGQAVMRVLSGNVVRTHHTGEIAHMTGITIGRRSFEFPIRVA